MGTLGTREKYPLKGGVHFTDNGPFGVVSMSNKDKGYAIHMHAYILPHVQLHRPIFTCILIPHEKIK